MTGLPHLIRTSKLLRSAIVLLLFGCMGIGIFGQYLIFIIIRSDIRQAIEEKIEANVPIEDLVLIKIANSNCPKDFQFTEEGREFRYHSEMYDIVYQEMKGDTTYYYCIHDVRETKLYADLNHQIHQEYTTNPIHHKKQVELLKKLPEVYFCSVSSIFLGFTRYNQHPNETPVVLQNAFLSIHLPPPEIA